MTVQLAPHIISTGPLQSPVADLENELARHHRAAFGWALACCRWDRSVAEDVLQTSYLKLLDGRARFGGQSEFKTFLFGVIRRTATEDRRRRAIRSALSFAWRVESMSDGRVDATGLASLVHDETSRELIAALGRLSARQRDVLHLVFYQDLSIAAAAGVLGMSVGSARVHYERGKANLRRVLGENGTNAE